MSLLEITVEGVSETTLCTILNEVQSRIHNNTNTCRLKLYIKLLEMEEE